MYLNYFKDWKSYSKAKIGLLKPINDYNKAQINLPQLVDTVIVWGDFVDRGL